MGVYQAKDAMKLDWHKIFVHDLDLHYGLEVLFRTCIMFIIILVVVRLSGKRGVRQLSIFEIAIIISLGSAAGDPMFYKDVAIIPALFVCSTIIVLYRFITWLTDRNEHIEKWVEGKPVYLVENGVFAAALRTTHPSENVQGTNQAHCYGRHVCLLLLRSGPTVGFRRT